MGMLLKGKVVTDRLASEMAVPVAALKAAGIVPTLAVVRVGNRLDDLSYERGALKRAEALGVSLRSFVLPTDASMAQLEDTIHDINCDVNIHGCLLFRPLPPSFDEKRICEMLDVRKDVDGITLASLASVFTDGNEGFSPCTAAACLHLLDTYDIPVEGKHVVVIGRSLVVGKPVSLMLLKGNATVTICHSHTKNLAAISCEADIVICAVGRARAFGSSFFSASQTVLDVGINFDSAGRMCGDVDFETVEPLVAALTPIPGGLGTVTTSLIMLHTVQAAEKARVEGDVACV